MRRPTRSSDTTLCFSASSLAHVLLCRSRDNRIMTAPAACLYAVVDAGPLILRDKGDKVMSTHGFQRVSRRRFLQKSALAAGTLALPLAPFRARAAKLVTLTLDWLYQGPNAGFLVAHEKGYYADAGFDVDISAGKGSASTAQLVASKATQVGFADGFVVAAGDAKGMNIKTVGSIFRRNPASIMMFADSPIK